MKKARSLSVAILTATLLAAIGVASQPGHAQDKSMTQLWTFSLRFFT